MRHFNDLVNVAGGNGDGPGNGAARNKLLHGSGVRAACRQHFHLPFDLVGVRHGLHELHHAAVRNHGAVIQLDGGTCAQVGDLVVRRGAGNVAGDGDVQGDGEVGLDVQRAGLRAPQPYFLLNGEGGHEVAGGLLFGSLDGAEGFNQHVASGAVVQGLHVHAVPHFHQVAFTGDGVAHGDVFFHFLLAHAQVDEEIGHFRQLGAFRRGHHVDGLHAHDADEVFFAVDDDALGRQRLGVKAAQGEEFDEPFVVNVTDHEADFVHVGGGHHGFFSILAFHDGNHAAQVVHPHGVHQRGHFLNDEITDFVFKPRSARSHANLTKQFQIHNAANVMVFVKVG